MDPGIPPAAHVGPPDNFASDILREFEFGADYDFGREFSFGGYSSDSSVGSFDYDGVSVEFSESGSFRGSPRHRHHHWRIGQSACTA